MVGVKFIEISRWAGHTDLETVHRRQETPDRTCGQTKAPRHCTGQKGFYFFLFFFPRLRCKLVRTFFFAIFEIDLGSSDDDDDAGLARAIVKRVINEFLKGSLGILENFNWNMLLRKSVQNCH